jgi:DNA-directed RNA polymerase subunit RPC12/RpoP
LSLRRDIMEVQEYGCNQCRGTFKKINSDDLKVEKNVKCPDCGSSNIEKLDSMADKLKFFSRFAFSGG